jgi:hypothetical protein
MSILKPLFAAAFCAATLAACVVAPVPPYGTPAAPYAYASDGEIVATVAPPAPYVETVPAAPFVGAVWVGGYWGYHGGRHEWVPGRYEAPRPGYRYEPHHWVQQSAGHWRLEGGAWRRG